MNNIHGRLFGKTKQDFEKMPFFEFGAAVGDVYGADVVLLPRIAKVKPKTSMDGMGEAPDGSAENRFDVRGAFCYGLNEFHGRAEYELPLMLPEGYTTYFDDSCRLAVSEDAPDIFQDVSQRLSLSLNLRDALCRHLADVVGGGLSTAWRRRICTDGSGYVTVADGVPLYSFSLLSQDAHAGIGAVSLRISSGGWIPVIDRKPISGSKFQSLQHAARIAVQTANDRIANASKLLTIELTSLALPSEGARYLRKREIRGQTLFVSSEEIADGVVNPDRETGAVENTDTCV